MSTRTKLFAAAAALGVLVLALSRGEEPSAQAQALRDDPMAAYVPPGGRLVDTDGQNEGTSFGKPVQARFSRLFELPDGGGPSALRHARAAALAAGWIEVGSRETVFVADRQLPTGGAHLGVTVFLDRRILPDGVSPPALLVSLRHRRG